MAGERRPIKVRFKIPKVDMHVDPVGRADSDHVAMVPPPYPIDELSTPLLQGSSDQLAAVWPD